MNSCDRGNLSFVDFVNAKEWAVILENVFCEIHLLSPRMSLCYLSTCLTNADHEPSLGDFNGKCVTSVVTL